MFFKSAILFVLMRLRVSTLLCSIYRVWVSYVNVAVGGLRYLEIVFFEVDGFCVQRIMLVFCLGFWFCKC